MLFTSPRRATGRSNSAGMSRADLICFLTVLLIIIGIVAINLATYGLPVH